MIEVSYGTARVTAQPAYSGRVTAANGKTIHTAENYDPYDLACAVVGVCGALGYPIGAFKALLDEAGGAITIDTEKKA